VANLCVFCGSRVGNRPEYSDAAAHLGRLLGEEQHTLVYGGGRVGLMGVVAESTLSAGGTVVGVIPRLLSGAEIAFTEATELILVETMHERKALMASRADMFVALPGGFGTCDELFEILTWQQLRIHESPIALLNVAGFFDTLLKWIDEMVSSGLLRADYREMLHVCETAEQVIALLEACGATTPG